ncbi:hypothetical protein AB0A05_07320 [Streptomyces sp. NPDC046374]|uniref:hypothetical protein n=1 Tax=Streptomyces sp. NPDC046374 TaxID=3154917 RepID=UPI0033C82DE0
MTDEELNALTRSLPPVDLVQARRRAEEEYFATWEPSIVPMPDFVPGGAVRFSCPRGCGWFHDENPGLDAAMQPYRLVVPLDPTSEDITAAINREASTRARAQQERITTAIVEHDQQAHSRSLA